MLLGERALASIDEDTDRLRLESRIYSQFIKEEDEKIISSKSLRNDKGSPPIKAHCRVSEETHQLTTLSDENEQVQRSTKALQRQTHELKYSCEKNEVELERLAQLFVKQKQVSNKLSYQEELLLIKVNSLEVCSHSFGDINHQLNLQCNDSHQEVTALSRVQLHSIFFKIEVSNQGLRSPFINNLRLSHKSKDDLCWNEINSAWSNASQLLIFVGKTVKFISQDLRIVPLTTCAKIIKFDGKNKIVYNLGIDFESRVDNKSKNIELRCQESRCGPHDIIQAIRMFNILLKQMFLHLKHIYSNDCDDIFKNIPSVTFPKVIQDLKEIQKDDDAYWESVILSIASNLKWLSRNAIYFWNMEDTEEKVHYVC